MYIYVIFEQCIGGMIVHQKHGYRDGYYKLILVQVSPTVFMLKH